MSDVEEENREEEWTEYRKLFRCFARSLVIAPILAFGTKYSFMLFKSILPSGPASWWCIFLLPVVWIFAIGFLGAAFFPLHRFARLYEARPHQEGENPLETFGLTAAAVLAFGEFFAILGWLRPT